MFFIPLHGNEKQGRAFVSLLTCSPGEEVYSFFGHTALRYCNFEKDIDLVFNYGVFDFTSSDFVWNFVLGNTDYMLGVIEYPYFVQEYAMRGSGVVEQVLNLDSIQTDRLFALLRDNYRPINRVYRYNYFYNNCTTKARDIIETCIADSGFIKYDFSDGQSTFRDVVHCFTSVSPWYSFGIDLLLGCDADVVQSARTLQFIPSTLMKDFSRADIVVNSGIAKPLLIKTDRPVEIVADNNESTLWFTPLTCFYLVLLLVIVVTCIEYRKNKIFWGVDVLLLLLQGIAGMLITFMSLFSVHPTVDSNLLIMLFNPLSFIVLFVYVYNIIKCRKPKIMRLQAVTVALFLVVAPFLPQYIPYPVYIFAVTLLIRSLFIIFYTVK